MKLKRIAPFVLVALLLLPVAMLHAAARPNVVVFLADDSGWGDYSFNGNPNLRTPHIDSIARDGAVLDRFYVCSVCAPTRAEFLTGRYHSRGGVRGVSTGLERLDTDEKTLADAFKAAGYATGAFGKWHNGSQWPHHPNATNLDDRITWDIVVNSSSEYDVEILYTCPVADAGSTIELSFNGAKLTGQVAPGWDPPLYTHQDTIARPPGESKMKEFRTLLLGVMRLEKGRGLLRLRATRIPGKTVMDLRQLNLTLRK